MSAAPPGQYPVRLEVDYVEEANRLTTFFRWFLAIPHIIILYVYGIAAFFVMFALWVSIMITGRRPEGMARFIASYLRWSTRVNAYTYLLTDKYPPFEGD